jgi:hypothetical protein
MVTFDGGEWSRADAESLPRENSALTDARTPREWAADINSVGACARLPRTRTRGIVQRVPARHLDFTQFALEMRQYKSTSSARRDHRTALTRA